jgi:histidine triad (HIT) family protein
MSDCVFCAIRDGKAPAEFVYRDDRTMAFMDIRPATRGHLLVVPTRHSVELSDVPIEDAAAVMNLAVDLSRRAVSGLGATGVNLLVASGVSAWQTVWHFHLHVVPRYEGDDLTPPWSLDLPVVDRAQLAEPARLIRESR